MRNINVSQHCLKQPLICNVVTIEHIDQRLWNWGICYTKRGKL